MIKIIYTKSYIRRVKKFFKFHPEIVNQYKKTLKLLEINPYHATLRLHKIKSKSLELYSVSINMSYRISLEFIVEKDNIILIDIGKHEKIY